MNPIAIFGHRGARGLLPENTLEGFACAHAIGLTGVEFDVGLSEDGIAAVHHDPRPNPDIARAADGIYVGKDAPLLRDLPYARIAQYDVGRLRPGSDYEARYPDQRPIDGAHIPSLDAALGALAGLDLLIEVKTFPDRPDDTAAPEAMAASVIASLRRNGALEDAVLFAFDWRVLRVAAALEPCLRRCCLSAPDTVAEGRLWLDGADLGQFDGRLPRAVAATGAACWAPFHASLDQADLAEAQSLGLRVLPWTVNTPEAFERMIALGVDGMISDRPDLARSAVEAVGGIVAGPGFVRSFGASIGI
ncbi:glycerophosphodiester phosphodiesterase [Acidiphilium sp. AL]|uniref:glycerophosphodiester phosphodiesterase family protein n=1 Tax=Acidiphilium sp. AL TaxID=2871704 RepID=UPI0021CB60BD|nr:glycerophosphodiester phosphodiesterase family protein [Acidiphilium sp. AL]MCU4160234.1 glycerophosphodiester phosphodiesterase [Acidiphilium sp. AL]